MGPIFSLAYTSCRPECIGPAITLWDSRCTLELCDHEWVITVDADNQAAIERCADLWPIQTHIQHDQPFNSVRGWNLAAAKTIGRVIIGVSDDFLPPFGWDKQLLEIDGGKWIDREAVVLVHDGYCADICTLPIVTRARYHALGYLFYPGYESMYADTELTAHARLDGVLIDARHIPFEHRHPDCGKRKADTHDTIHGSPARYARGRKLFAFRAQLGFPIDDASHIPIDLTAPGREMPAAEDFAALLCVNQDDLCLADTCERLFDEGVRHFFFGIPDHFWSGKPSIVSSYDGIIQTVAFLQLKGAHCEHRIFRRADYHHGQTRAQLEGDIRNAMLDWIVGSDDWRLVPVKAGWAVPAGFPISHVLVVDGDELWRHGLFLLIRQAVQADAPKAMSSRMVPVAGQPGYPIAGAKDAAVVYMAAGVRFKVCRVPDVPEIYPLPGENIFHFTCTRRSHEALIEKLKESGHYDDPAYAFDEWIEKTLPRIRPGLQNVHMYRHEQIWPAVRSWTKIEAKQLPDGIKPHLGLQHSQNDEEACILNIFADRIHDDQPRGRFLDIGAYDGITFSNTRRLTEFGWSGVLVEPAPAAFAGLLGLYRDNPQIQLIQAAIGTGRLEVFHDSSALSQGQSDPSPAMVSSLDDEHVALWAPSASFAAFLTHTITVADLCYAVGTEFDFLNLDVEGKNLWVFNEMPDELFEWLHCVCIEHDGHVEEIINRLSPFGFQWKAQNAENLIMAKHK